MQFCIDKNIKPVKGNHEVMMLRAVERSDKFFGLFNKEAELYYYNGGQETQYSYIKSKSYSDFKKFKTALKALGHFDFINGLPFKYEFEKVVISHAGIIEGGDDVSIVWNRKPPAFLNKLQIFGHTPLQEYNFKKNYFVNIDTGCVYHNKLTAIIVDISTGEIEEIIQENYIPADTQ